MPQDGSRSPGFDARAGKIGSAAVAAKVVARRRVVATDTAESRGMLDGMARTQAVYYRDKKGTEPVNEFIEALPAKRAAKIDDYVEEYLNGRPPEAPPPEFPITSQIEGELRELRVRFANTRYRVLYQRSENLLVLLHAIEKDTGAVPTSAVELAKRRMADFKRRMDA